MWQGPRLRGTRSDRLRERPFGHELAGDPPRLARRPRRAPRTSAPAATGARSSVSSITAAMPRNRSRPPRNACTATSLAAFSVHGAVPPARAASRARRRQRERLLVDRLERQRPRRSTRSSGAHRDVDALGVVQRVGDRHAHVRVAEVRERRAVAQLDQAVDDRLRVDDDVDLLVRRAEQVVGLDQLEPLVHQRRRVDRDLAAHRPGRVGERLLDRDVLEVCRACGRGTGRPRRSGSAGRRFPGARRRAAGAAPNARSRPG